ncbi:MAG: phosphatase PAP2 family protein [Parcubacteria group bacterium]
MNFFRHWAKNIIFLLVYIFAGGALVLIIDGLVSGSELTPFNTAAEVVMSHIRTPFLTDLFLFATNLGSPTVLIILTFGLAIYLLLKKDTYDAVLYLASIFLAVFALTVLKNMFDIPRPEYSLIHLASWSFPSGHATVATAFFFATGYTFISKIRSAKGKLALVLFCIFGAGMVCFSRVYLGAHWALDVLAGIALGLVCVTMVILVFNIFLEESKWRRRETRGIV